MRLTKICMLLFFYFFTFKTKPKMAVEDVLEDNQTEVQHRMYGKIGKVWGLEQHSSGLKWFAR